MELSQLDGTKLLIFMVAGGLFALAGLWLMFRPKTSDGAAKIEIFGLKLESSSAGLVVFLIGAVFLATPLVVEEKQDVSSGEVVVGDETAPTDDESDVTDLPENVESGIEFDTSLPLPKRADREELEENGTISDANALEVGQTVKGKLARDDLDWFVFAVDPNEADSFRVTFRNNGDGCPQYKILNELENQVAGHQICSFEISATHDYFIDTDRYYLRVDANGARTTYEVALSYP